MKKINIVKENKDFTKIIHSKNFVTNNCFSIHFMNNDLNRKRYGITVSKKIGNAVTRNKIKRQLKNIIDKNEKLFQNSKDYIIIVKRGILDCDFQTKESNLVNLVSKIKWR